MNSRFDLGSKTFLQASGGGRGETAEDDICGHMVLRNLLLKENTPLQQDECISRRDDWPLGLGKNVICNQTRRSRLESFIL